MSTGASMANEHPSFSYTTNMAAFLNSPLENSALESVYAAEKAAAYNSHNSGDYGCCDSSSDGHFMWEGARDYY